MNKALAFVVLISFISSSCATAPVVNHSQKISSQVQVYPFAYFNSGYKNTVTLASRDYSSFRILGTKAAESTDDSKPDTKKTQPSSGKNLINGVYAIGLLALGGWGIYKYITDPDSFK